MVGVGPNFFDFDQEVLLSSLCYKSDHADVDSTPAAGQSVAEGEPFAGSGFEPGRNAALLGFAGRGRNCDRSDSASTRFAECGERKFGRRLRGTGQPAARSKPRAQLCGRIWLARRGRRRADATASCLRNVSAPRDHSTDANDAGTCSAASAAASPCASASAIPRACALRAARLVLHASVPPRNSPAPAARRK
jgi:hypothetical protein